MARHARQDLSVVQGRGFDVSVPIVATYPATIIGRLDAGRVRLKVKDKIKRNAALRQWNWGVLEIIGYSFRCYVLKLCDLIFTVLWLASARCNRATAYLAASTGSTSFRLKSVLKGGQK